METIVTKKVSIVLSTSFGKMKERIQQKARELFLKYGFKSVTMDEIASQSGISKKTIYQFFADKDELVEDVMQKELNSMRDECIRQREESQNAIEELIQDLESKMMTMEAMNPFIVFDLEKFYPQAFLVFKKHKESFLLELIRKNIERGIEEGVYRNDFNVDIISKFRLESSFLIFNQDLYPNSKYSLMDVARELYYHFLYGIATEKGRLIIEKFQHKKTI